MDGASVRRTVVGMQLLGSVLTSARLIIFKTLASGTSAELPLITSRASTDTLAKQALVLNKNDKEARFKEFWRKKLN